MKYILILFQLYVVVISQVNYYTQASDDFPLVSIQQGKLKGFYLESRNGKKYSAFQGIPYARVQERFEMAKLDDGWGDAIHDAIEFGPMCTQPVFGDTETILGSEDCLFVNVYSPDVKTKEKMPVLVFIHGGGFAWGAGSLYKAKYFMDENVVLVTINYRLGIFGFLSTGDEELQGNAGLKDQVLALQWVRDNIDSFGGNRDLVTIMGESAGGAAVGLLVISPMSQGLFHRAISQSGSSLNHWSLQRKPLEVAKTIAKTVNCPIGDSKSLVVCLKSKSDVELISAQGKLIKWFLFNPMIFTGAVEKSNGKEPVFLPQTPYELVVAGKYNNVPYMIGHCQDEGLFYSVPVMSNESLTSELNSKWKELTPNVLMMEHSVKEEDFDDISKRVREFYFENDEINEDSWSSLTELFSDRFFNHGVYTAAKLHSKKTRVYPYIFNFPGDYSVLQSVFGVKERFGVSHADDLQYLFNGAFNTPEYTEETSEITEFSQSFVKLLVSFVTSGKPTATWGPENYWKPIAPHKEQSEWYQIDIKTGVWEDDYKSKFEFWESLPIQELKNEITNVQKDEL